MFKHEAGNVSRLAPNDLIFGALYREFRAEAECELYCIAAPQIRKRKNPLVHLYFPFIYSSDLIMHVSVSIIRLFV